MEACIVRDAEAIVADQDTGTHHSLILCIWQKGADALIQQYKKLESTLPKGNNLTVTVMTREELMRRFKVKDQTNEPTTDQINNVCQNINKFLPGHEVHLYIDECWITLLKTFAAHLTAVSIFPLTLFDGSSLRQIQTK
jgi:hypothetical protein